MVNRKRPFKKGIWISKEDRERAREIREETGINDSDIFSVGLDRFKPDGGILRNMFKFGYGRDDLVEAEHQGNVEQMTPSKRARLFFSISESEWALLSEEEKLNYISRMEAKKERAGGSEMSNRDTTFQNKHMDSTTARDFFENEMKLATDRLQKRNRKFVEDRLG